MGKHTERPILFNAEMVRAVLDGRKTVTRRVCKDQTPFAYKHVNNAPCVPNGGTYTGWIKSIQDLAIDAPVPCPYGSPGDRLWVRETWATLSKWDNTKPRDIPEGEPIWYVAEGEPMSAGKIRPSIFLTRWASRILLEVVSVRVERVQEITTKGALDEGIDVHPSPYCITPYKNYSKDRRLNFSYAPASFASLWDSINAKRGYGWDANPWVWVVEFKRITPSGGDA